MSFGITINGHVDGLNSNSPEEAAKAEEIIEKVKALVADLDGVTYATFSGMGISRNLLEDAQAKQVQPSQDKAETNTGSLAEPPSDGGATSGRDPA